MQACSSNRITQRQHGTSKAVDHADDPDPIIYAPEDGTIDSYQQRGSGTSDAGLALRMRGANGLHQFGHTERSLVAVGSRVKRGQPIAVMGYTGYTIPDNVPAGSHVHWWVQTPNGYVYPPNLINEPFMKLGSEGGTNVVLTAADANAVYKALLKREGDAGGIKNYTGKTLEFMLNDMVNGEEFKRINTKTVEKVVERIVEKPVPVPGSGKSLKDYTLGEITKELGL